MREVELRMNEQEKYDVIKELVDHGGNKERASLKLGISKRHVDRLIKKYKEKGKSGFVHGNRERKPISTLDKSISEDIILLYKTKYQDFNFNHFKEYLEEEENIFVSYTFIYDTLTKATKKSFGISKESSSGSNMYARIDLTDLVVSENFQNYDLKWALYEGDTKITTGSFVTTSDGSNSINMATNVLIDSTVEKNYNLYIWIQEIGIDQSEMMSGSISGKITVTGEKDKLNTLASKVLSETTKTNPTWGNSIEQGLYIQKDDSTKSNYGFPTYYYRGDVTNNYVSFAGQTWRIMRINEDGSIRIITQNGIGEFLFDEDDNCEWIEVEEGNGYYSNCNTDYLTATIKDRVDTWYSSKIIGNNNSNVIIGSFCNDITNNAYKRYVYYNDSGTVAPQFTCPQNANHFNSKSGLITADEITYMSSTTDDFSYYTFLNNGTDWWSMTSWKDSDLFLWSNSNGSYLEVQFMDTPLNVRPVINLKSDVIVSSGNGTSSSPYVIQ